MIVYIYIFCWCFVYRWGYLSLVVFSDDITIYLVGIESYFLGGSYSRYVLYILSVLVFGC